MKMYRLLGTNLDWYVKDMHKLKVKERKNIKKKHLASSEVKLDILVSTMKEMIQNIMVRVLSPNIGTLPLNWDILD